jgi:hypothetical protein
MTTFKLHWPNAPLGGTRAGRGSAPLAVIIAASLATGCLAGWLLIGWVIWPVQYTGDAYTYELNPAEKIQYVAAVADSYATTRQIDVVRQRLQTWTAGEKAAALAQLYAEDQAQGKAEEAGIVTDLALQLQRWEAWDPVAVDQATSQVAAQYNRQSAPGKAQAVAVFAAALGTAPAVPSAPRRAAAPQEILPGILEDVLRLGLVLLALLVSAAVIAATFLLVRRRAARIPVSQAQPPEPAETAAAGQSPGRAAAADPALLMREESIYELGMDDFDAVYPILARDGDLLGECGVSISTTLNEDPPRKVTAFEVWLFAKDALRTPTKVLVSEAAYRDDGQRDRLSSRGPRVLAGPDARLSLESGCLAVDAQVVRLGYGDGTRSYFDRLTLALAVREIDEVVMPMDA